MSDIDTTTEYCIAVSGIGYLHRCAAGDQVQAEIRRFASDWYTPTLVVFKEIAEARSAARDLARDYKRLGVHTDRHVSVQERTATTRYTEWRDSENETATRAVIAAGAGLV